MYHVKLTGKEGSVVINVPLKGQARKITEFAKASGLQVVVTYTPRKLQPKIVEL